MAGDWIKFELATPDKPEVWAIAAALSIDPDAVVGKLLRVWGWFDQQTENGNAPSVSKMLLDRLVGVTGFCKAVIDADWMHDDGVTLSLPHFDRHNGKTAKNRATTAKRVASFKNKTGKSNATSNDEVTPEPLPKEEKRREDNNILVPSERERIPAREVIELFNRVFTELPEVRLIDDKRLNAVKARWKATENLRSIEKWEKFFNWIKQSDFLMGRDKAEFKCSFDWIFKAGNFAKIYEGNYHK